jgi:hypothetical protein
MLSVFYAESTYKHFMLSAIMLCAITLSAIMLSSIMLSSIKLSVLAPVLLHFLVCHSKAVLAVVKYDTKCP